MPDFTRQKIMIIWAVVLIFLTGCATVGTNFKTTGLSQLRLSESTESDVISYFGQPFKKQARSENGTEYQLLIYVYAEGTPNSGKSRRLATEFVAGRLNAYLFHSALGNDMTDFDANSHSVLVAGKSRKSDVIDALGKPHGEVKFPSLLLKSEFGSLPEVVPPDTAASALVYNYLETVRKASLLTTQLKLVIAYLSADGTVVEVRHFDGTL
jgi:hypothetical protein